jgi:hypothetical protein
VNENRITSAQDALRAEVEQLQGQLAAATEEQQRLQGALSAAVSKTDVPLN